MIELCPFHIADTEEASLLWTAAGQSLYFLYLNQLVTNRAKPFTFRLDGWDGAEVYPVEDQRPGHRIELAPIGP